MHVMARTIRHLVVDGSNIATESRTLPSLAQLDEAVRAVQAEDPDRQVTVIVDATFAHRIDASERQTFEEASDAGEILVPPAGAVGRGDAFILQVAEKAGAAVLSNDSFQEFHGEHKWLFEEGRLIGGKPVADVGWVFVARVPVRGPASRRATRETSKSSRSSRSRGSKKQSTSKAAAGPPPKPSADNPPPGRKNRRSKKDAAKPSGSTGSKSAKNSNSRSSENSRNSKNSKKSEPKKNEARKQKGKSRHEALNSANEFMRFVTQHSIGDEVSGEVERFSSHGCYLRASSAQCYLPSSAMGDPAPTRARDVVALAQTIIVKVESLDSDRRGINVSLVRTVEDDGTKKRKKAAGNSLGKKVSETSQQQASVADESAREANLTRSKTIVATKKSAKKARKKPAAKKVTKKKAAKATSSARATKSAARRKAAKKRPAKKAAKKTTKKAAAKKRSTKKATKKKAAKKRPAAKKAVKKATKKKAAKKRPAKKTAKKATKKATAKKRSTKKAAKKATKKR